MSERIVLVDMDGVIANFDKAALENVPPELVVERRHFYIKEDYPDDIKPIIEEAYNAPGFFEDLEPMPGLHEGWQTMIDNDYSPRITSAPLSSNPTSVEGKIKWLNRVMVPEFGHEVVDNAIIDKEKWKYDGLALIDDRPSVAKLSPGGGTKAEWEHVLFGWPHLQRVPLATAAFRLLSWNDNNLIPILNEIEQNRNS